LVVIFSDIHNNFGVNRHMPTLNYRMAGSGTQTVVVLHGLFGSLDNLGAITRLLGEQYQTLAIDLPNHGRSDWVRAEAMNLKYMANAVAELLQELNLSRVMVLGHSLGGKVAMELAISHPSVVSKLIVADIAPVQYGDRHNRVFDSLSAIDLTTVSSRKDADKKLLGGSAGRDSGVQDPGVRMFLLKNLYKDESGAYQWRMNLTALIEAYPNIIAAPSRSPKFDKPVLFIKGEDSEYILPEHREEVLVRFSDPQMKTMGGCGHWLHAQKPDVFGRLCQKFLA